MRQARPPAHRRSDVGPVEDPAIRIVVYDPAWPEQFAAEAAVVATALGGSALRVDHVGSTSVPMLAAKPIVDLQVSVPDVLDLAPLRTVLERIGYGYERYPDPDGVDRYPFFGKPPERPRRFHIHLAQAGSRDERRHLAVRDFLRAHPDEAAAYADVKRAAVARHAGDRLAYMEAKGPFVAALEQRALAWAASAGQPGPAVS